MPLTPEQKKELERQDALKRIEMLDPSLSPITFSPEEAGITEDQLRMQDIGKPVLFDSLGPEDKRLPAVDTDPLVDPFAPPTDSSDFLPMKSAPAPAAAPQEALPSPPLPEGYAFSPPPASPPEKPPIVDPFTGQHSEPVPPGPKPKLLDSYAAQKMLEAANEAEQATSTAGSYTPKEAEDPALLKAAEEQRKREEEARVQATDESDKAHLAAVEESERQIAEQEAILAREKEEQRLQALLEQREKDAEEIARDADQRLQDKMKKRDELEEQYQKAELSSFWANKTTGQKVISGIALAIGSFATNMMNVGRSQKLPSFIDEVLEADLALKKANIEKLRDSVAIARTGVKDAIEAKKILSDNAITQQIAAVNKLEQTTIKHLLIKNPQMSPAEIDANPIVMQLREKAAQLRGQQDGDYKADIRSDAIRQAQLRVMESQIAENIAQAEKAKRQKPLEEELIRSQIEENKAQALRAKAEAGLLGGGDGSGGAALPGLSRKDRVKYEQTLRETEYLDAFGTRRIAPDKETAQKMRNASAIFDTVQSSIKQLRDQDFSMSPDDIMAKQALHSSILTDLKELKNLGAITGPDMGLMENQLGGSAATALNWTDAKLNQTLTYLTTAYKNNIKYHTLSPTEEHKVTSGAEKSGSRNVSKLTVKQLELLINDPRTSSALRAKYQDELNRKNKRLGGSSTQPPPGYRIRK